MPVSTQNMTDTILLLMLCHSYQYFYQSYQFSMVFDFLESTNTKMFQDFLLCYDETGKDDRRLTLQAVKSMLFFPLYSLYAIPHLLGIC